MVYSSGAWQDQGFGRNFEYHPMNRELLMEDCMCEPCEANGSYDVNMEPDDIEVSDTVTVIWEIG